METNELYRKEKELINEGDGEKINSFYDENPGILRLDSDVKKMLVGVGFKVDDFNKNCCDFSGGWIMRLSLIKILVMDPDILFLDEPTNHLDLDGVIWLENYLLGWKRTLIIVSHSRYFLDSVCNKIISLEDRVFKYYNGNFSFYLEKRMMEWNKIEKEYLEKRKRIKSKKEKKKLRPRKYNVDFKLENEGIKRIGEISCLIKIEDVNFYYNKKNLILEDINMGIFKGDRIGIVGPNGVGKTTFIKLLMGDLDVKKGNIKINNKIKMGRYVQHFSEILPMNRTPVEYLMSEYDLNMEEARKCLGRFGLISNAHNNLISKCSGGQKARIVLSGLSNENLDVILMDEPTNHLDIESVDSLIVLLKNIEGALVIIVHDMYLLNEIGCDLYLCENKRLEKFDGNMEDYKDYVLKKLENSNNDYKKKKISKEDVENIENVSEAE